MVDSYKKSQTWRLDSPDDSTRTISRDHLPPTLAWPIAALIVLVSALAILADQAAQEPLGPRAWDLSVVCGTCTPYTPHPSPQYASLYAFCAAIAYLGSAS